MSADDEVFDVEALWARVPELRAEFDAAAPWPHVVIRGVFPDAVLRRAADEIATADESAMDASRTRTQVKRECPDASRFGPATARLLGWLDGPEMVEVMAAITGVPDLVADPTHHWAGVHVTPPGGFTMVHTDFLEHPVTGLHHRSNCLLYLNEGWQESWGGCLELWPRAMDRLGRRIVPEMNTLVLMATGASTMHGLPEPVATPDGRSRLSLATYQYSKIASGDVDPVGFSKFHRRPSDPWRVGLPSRWDVKERLPEPVRRGAATVRQRFRGSQ